MTEKAIKINEQLAAKGKRLDEVTREEFDDIAHSVGLRRQDKKQGN
jgi:BMFP domain-containing protein YqiC